MKKAGLGSLFAAVAVITVLALGCGGGTGTVLSIQDVSLAEGDTGTTSFVFTVAISREPDEGEDVSVSWATSDGTATVADGDYAADTGTLTFTNGGPTTQQVTVVVNGDYVVEPDETFHVDLTNPVNGTIGDSEGLGTITNDDLALRVDPTADGTDGLTWPTAAWTIQEAVAALDAVGGGEVWVAAATYTNGGGTGPVLVMKPNVQVYGGFEGYADDAGAQETLRSQRNFTANETTLDGQGAAFHVVIGDDNCLLDGFTISNGNADGPTDDDKKGAGMWNSGVSPTVRNCLFSNNSATGGAGMCNDSGACPPLVDCTFASNQAVQGAGMWNEASSPLLSHCAFDNNTADLAGGGMYNSDTSSPDLQDCTFSANRADQTFAGGGGMYNSSSSPTLTDCTFVGNYGDTGGGMGNGDYASPVLTRCDFIDNTAHEDAGGLSNYLHCQPVLSDCTFSGNLAGRDGGGIREGNNCASVLRNCVFAGNNAVLQAGAVCCELSSTPTMASCAFFHNTAIDGGAIVLHNSTGTVMNCLFSSNIARGSANGSGGAVYNYGVNNASVFTNCLFEGNVADLHGGAVLNINSCAPTLINCTFSCNTAYDSGGAISNAVSAAFHNCVIWSNSAPTAPDVNTSSSTLTFSYCNVAGCGGSAAWDPAFGTDAGGNIDSNPLLANAPLRSDAVLVNGFLNYRISMTDASLHYSTGDIIEIGGDGVAHTVTAVSGLSVDFSTPLSQIALKNDPVRNWGPAATDLDVDGALLPGSPCIDAGDNLAVPADTIDLDNDSDTTEPVPFDFDGNDRFLNDPATIDTGNGSPPVVDMGAYEYRP